MLHQYRYYICLFYRPLFIYRRPSKFVLENGSNVIDRMRVMDRKHKPKWTGEQLTDQTIVLAGKLSVDLQARIEMLISHIHLFSITNTNQRIMITLIVYCGCCLCSTVTCILISDVLYIIHYSYYVDTNLCYNKRFLYLLYIIIMLRLYEFVLCMYFLNNYFVSLCIFNSIVNFSLMTQHVIFVCKQDQFQFKSNTLFATC